MPHLVRWNEELGPFGLVVIGAEVQGSPADEITAKSKALRIRFTVTQGGGVADAKGGGIPHTVLFDHTGKMRFEGHPGDPKLLNHVLVALGTSFVEKTGKSTFSKAVQPLADALKKGAAPVPVLQKLLPLQKKDEDAKALIEVMTATGKTQVDEAAELVESDPVSAYLRSQQLSGYYKGTSVGTKANEIFTKLKNNKSVVLELKARPSLDGLKKLDEFLEKSADGGDVADAAFQKMYVKQFAAMRTTLAKMKTDWPKAQATAEALEIGDKYGIKPK